MKKYILLLLIGIQFVNATEKDSIAGLNSFSGNFVMPEGIECDACGCSASGGSMGFSSMLNTNFIGIRYFNQHYKSSDGLYSNSPWYNESFNTVQVWARIPVHKNIQISALLPYHFHNRETATGNQDIKGIGDINVLAMYRLYQTLKDSTFLVHTLQVGGGIKAPTGKFDQANAGDVNPSFQVGTGSWDYLLATEYIIKRKKFGLNTILNYTIKTENDKKYRFGNQFNYAGTFFYLYEKEKLSFAPQLGFAGEVYGSNYQYSEVVRKTAGDILFGKAGFEVGMNKFSLGVNMMLPINQNLASERVEAKYRWSVNLNYSL
ncbi:transporter [Flavobacterium sp.]|uniref:transporter n=1 Tax=Flavobacterium sp. TaxID=239 RepID=UPI0024888704|nr:transporter [Flavobacterium sp.]MDI1317523.1 transporter [Flavobacterium sp.]